MKNHTVNHSASTKQETKTFIKKLKKSFYEYTGLPSAESEKVVNIGYLNPIDHKQYIVAFMRKWVHWKDSRLKKIPRLTNEYADEFSQRGFTYDEFKLILKGNIKEEHFSRYLAFQYLYLTDAGERDIFRAENVDDDDKPALDKYIETLSAWVEAEIPVLHEFFFKTKLPVYFPTSALKRHSYILAQSGSGKSEIAKLLLYDLQRRSKDNRSKSLIVIEPHGDLSQEVAAFCLNRGKYKERLLYLDPNIRDTAKNIFGEDILGADYTFVLNPFWGKRTSPKEVTYLTEELSKAFFEIINSKETFQMEALIEACVETLLWKGNSSIADLKRFMDDNENDDLIEIGKNIPNPERQKLMHRFKTDPKITSTKSGIYYRLQGLIGNPNFYGLTVGESTIDLEKAMNSGKVIVFNISKGRMGSKSAPAFGKLLVALILGFVKKRQDLPKKERQETHMFIDEFHNYVTPSIEEVMSGTRKYALHVALAHQVMGQNMSPEMRRIISSNTAIKVAGENEPDSLEWMAKQMKGLMAKDFEELPQFSFFVSNKFNKKAGTFKFKAPSFLVDQNSPFYLSKEELKEYFLYLVHESGYYKKVEPMKIPEPETEAERSDQPLHVAFSRSKVYKHNFKE